MKVFNVNELKTFTDALFVGEVFDNFLLTEAEFQTAVTINISGMLSTHAEGEDEFATWKSLKALSVCAIRGDVLPKSFKIVLRLNNANALATSKSIGVDIGLGANYYLNIRFDGKSVSLTSGVSLATFSLDKSIEPAWDNLVARFLTTNSINFSYPES